MKISRTPYGTTKDGKAVDTVIITNSNGYTLQIITYGAYLISFKGPDRNGVIEELTKNCHALSDYEVPNNYRGATIGRYANRIADGQFTLDGVTYSLDKTSEACQLHGGPAGFNTRIWEAFPIKYDNRASVKLTLTSPDGDQGFPGNLDVALTITLTEENELFFLYEAVTDKPTCISLTNHTYWNLTGRPGIEKIYDHKLQINSDHILEVDDNLVPTGSFIPVDGTPFDFRTIKPIGEDIMNIPGNVAGYDHNFVMQDRKGVLRAATVIEPKSGRKMQILTDAPGLQFYTDNFDKDAPHTAFCLEAGELPDAMNHDNFYSPVLRPGELYRQVTIHSFSIEE